MKVTPPNGIVVDLGTTEASPTIGIVDYSRRETDAFGVTTVVRRDFSRRMSVKVAVPTSRIDANMALLATLRAKAALWSADTRYAWLNVTGYYEDLSVDLPYGDLSYCTLTVAGLAERETVADTGADPAANGRPSTLRFVEPVTITDAVLVSSSLAEDVAAAWSSNATYGVGATVARGHRVYESLVGGNICHDPAETGGQWLDTGPTNLWAMFDQALGSATIASAPVEIVLKAASATSALALLDTNAATVRVRAGSYDRTVVPDAAGKALFLDFAAAAGASVTVTITPAATNGAPRRWDDGAQWLDSGVWQDSLAAGDKTVTIGTFLFGAMKGLGTTEASPTAGITDYSVKERDEFGEVTVVERAWAKNMAVKAQIASSAVDVVANRIAAVRATPALWIGDTVRDSLIVYGFFRDFSIELGESVSKLSLSIEGLSKAAPIAPPATGGSVAWPDITDPTGTKPADNADVTGDNTSKDTAAVGGRPAGDVVAAIDAARARQDYLDTVTIPAVNQAVANANLAIAEARAEADAAVAEASRKIELAQAGLDQALDDLAAEVSRAQGAEEQLTQRIDTISANGGYDDTQVRALIQSVDTARADDKRAIGQRVDTVVTDYQRLDLATNTRITQTITAYSDADKAIGDRVDAIVTDYRGLNSTTNTRITDQVTALSDGQRALGRRIDSIVAEGGYDDRYVMSELSRIETASVTRDGALGQRVDNVITEYQRLDVNTNARVTMAATAAADANRAVADLSTSVTTRFTGVNDTLVRYDQRITTLSTGQESFAGRATSLEAAATAGTSAARNDRFAYWPNGQRNPIGWGDWSAEGRYTVERVEGVGSPYGVRTTNDAGANSGFVQVVPVTKGLWVIEVTAKCEAGSMAGAGITLHGAYNLDFLGDPDVNGQVRDSAAGETRSWTKAVDLSAWTNPTINFHAMQGWTGFGRAIASHYIHWYRVSIRPAGPGDIAGVKNAADIVSVSARTSTNEAAIADLPNRYAAVSRTATLEAQLNERAPSALRSDLNTVNGRIDAVNGATIINLNARIEDRATAIADAKAGAVASTVTTLRSDYNGTVATVSTQAGTIVDLQRRSASYIRFIADAGNGRASFDLFADGYGGRWALTGDGLITGNVAVDGNVIIGGTITARGFNSSTMSREGSSTWSGSITPGAGQTIAVPWNITLPTLSPQGRFIYDYKVSVQTNAGTQQSSTHAGLPLYTNYVDDGGLFVGATDAQGNTYYPASGVFEAVRASTTFDAIFVARISRGNYDTGIVRDGDYYYRNVSATYTVTSIFLHVAWIAI